VLPTRRFTCVSVSAAPVFIYLLRPSQPVSSFLGNVSWTARQHCDHCFSHGLIYVACSKVGNPTNIYIPAPVGKTQTFCDISSRRYHSNSVTCLSFPINCRTRHCTHSRCCLLLLARVCFRVSCRPFPTQHGAYFTPIHFHNSFRPLSCSTIHNIPIRFRRSPSRATPGNPASIYIYMTLVA